MTTGDGLRIGVSAAFFHADPKRALFKGKTLAYVEQEICHFIMTEGALPLLIPAPPPHTRVPIDLAAYARDLDGLLLQGGADVAPESYGETPLRPEWSGDRVRDLYEIDLWRAFIAEKKPVLGVCRGAQLLNVALGGTLYQDIATQVTGAKVHRDWDVYDNNTHALVIEPGSLLARMYPAQEGSPPPTVCSVHHQACKTLGRDLVVEARAADDGIIEAIRFLGTPWTYGIQWHPEWHRAGDGRLDGGPVLRGFLAAVRERKS